MNRALTIIALAIFTTFGVAQAGITSLYTALAADGDADFSDEDFVVTDDDAIVLAGIQISSGFNEDSTYLASGPDGTLTWYNGGEWGDVVAGTSEVYMSDLTFDTKSIDMTSVTEIKLSDEIKQQLKSEVEKMVFHASLTWGTWFMIFVLAVIAAKIAHRITLKTVFRPTKWAARKAEKVAIETAETVKKEWVES